MDWVHSLDVSIVRRFYRLIVLVVGTSLTLVTRPIVLRLLPSYWLYAVIWPSCHSCTFLLSYCPDLPDLVTRPFP